VPPRPVGKAAPVGHATNPVRLHLIDAAPLMRLFVTGLVLPEQLRHGRTGRSAG